MNDLIQQEIFEIEVLAWLKNKGFLRNMIFGGGGGGDNAEALL